MYLHLSSKKLKFQSIFFYKVWILFIDIFALVLHHHQNHHHHHYHQNHHHHLVMWDRRKGDLAVTEMGHAFLRQSSAAGNNLEHQVLLSPPPKCWGYRQLPLWLVYVLVGTASRASCTPDKHSTNGAASCCVSLLGKRRISISQKWVLYWSSESEWSARKLCPQITKLQFSKSSVFISVALLPSGLSHSAHIQFWVCHTFHMLILHQMHSWQDFPLIL